MISIDQLQPLPLFHRETVPEAYLDDMGHMNIRYYMAMYDDAVWHFFASFGMDRPHFRREKVGAFALQQFIRYLAEIHAGETVAIRTRILGRSAKRIHFMHFMINETTGKLASTIEVLGIHIDTTIRRSSPFPPPIAARIDAILAEHSQLDWNAPVCGVIEP